jgi:hypothetical protein
MIIETEFDIKEKVIINNDHSLIVVVQRIFISSNGIMYEVGYFDSSGTFKEPMFYDWQLSKKE